MNSFITFAYPHPRNMALNYAYDTKKLSKANVDCFEAGFNVAEKHLLEALVKGIEYMRSEYSEEKQAEEAGYNGEWGIDDYRRDRMNKYNAIVDKLDEVVKMIKEL